ncbi:MAG: efflux RND transporter permease subunit, partial [Muribaculaceae bacterium]|nr:efflux RND transporter permease subunit [Muribaculaceae bacterium]
SLEWTEGMVRRHNGQRVLEVECDPDPYNKNATPAKVMESIKDKVEAIELPTGYSMRWVGENDVSGEAIGKLLTLFPISVFIIFIVLLGLFNSWKKLTLILICFPFVLIGIAAALLITDTPFTFIAIIGFEGLVGMMIKNSIVLVDEINRLQTEEHQPVYQALVNATVSRVRPVMMASLTTVFGMIPLVGDPMYGSLAVTIIGGLTVGTIVTLMLLPMFYSLFFHVKNNTAE